LGRVGGGAALREERGFRIAICFKSRAPTIQREKGDPKRMVTISPTSKASNGKFEALDRQEKESISAAKSTSRRELSFFARWSRGSLGKREVLPPLL